VNSLFGGHFFILLAGKYSKFLIHFFKIFFHFLQPITLIYSTTSHEFGKRWGNNYLDNECHKGLVPFGYFSQSAYNACMARYNRTFDQESTYNYLRFPNSALQICFFNIFFILVQK
jgi:hypothetical protein